MQTPATDGWAQGWFGPFGAELAVQAIQRLAEGVVVHDADGRIVAFNRSALRVLELEADELQGRTPMDPDWRTVDVMGEPLPGSLHPASRALRTGATTQGFVMGVHRPGTAGRWLEVSASPLHLEGFSGAVASFVDITERRAAQDQLRDTLAELQRYLLPSTLPAITGADVAVSYQAAGPMLVVGGDFYDLYPAGRDRWAFFVGDVCGHTVRAAAATSLARHTLRAAGQHLDDPRAVLQSLDEALRAEPHVPFCTAAFGFIGQGSGPGLRVDFALGGHPRPIRIPVTGPAEPVGAYGSLLGVHLSDRSHHRTSIDLDPGEQLVFYTDGLLESRRPVLDEEGLARHASAGSTAPDTAHRLLDVALDTDRPRQDDTAILVIRAAPADDDPDGAGGASSRTRAAG